MDFRKDKEEFEKSFILRALATFGGINKTAEGANIPKKTLLRKMEKYGIDSKQHWSREGHGNREKELCG